MRTLLFAAALLMALMPTADADSWYCNVETPVESGGLVGATDKYAEDVGNAGCVLVGATFLGAAAMVDQMPPVVVPPLCCYHLELPVDVNEARGVVLDQVAEQGGMACEFVLGSHTLCLATEVSHPGGEAGQCRADVPEAGGVAGATLNLAEASCDRADQAVDYAVEVSCELLCSSDPPPCCISLGGLVRQVSEATHPYTGPVVVYATNEVAVAKMTVNTVCGATTTYATGGACPVTV